MTSAGVGRVLIDSPLPQLDRLFDFHIPPHLDAAAKPGVRVRVPFRHSGRITNGFLIERVERSEHTGRLSDVDAVVSAAQVVPERLWSLARAVADRSAGSAIDVLRLAIPSRYVRAEKSWLEAESSEPTPSCPTCAHTDEVDAALLDGRRITYLSDPQPTGPHDGIGAWASDIAARACRMLANGRSSILIVPDYRDREQVVAAVAAHRSRGSVRLDAQQTGHARYQAYLRCLEPEPVIVIGTRSAAYAPVSHLGLMVLWDDADPLLAEPLAPYAHARDVCLVRQQMSGCALLVTAHYRSVEVQRLVELGWMEALRRDRSYRPSVIATALQHGSDAARARIPSTAWQTARNAVETGPVLVLVARPGYAPTLACSTCRAPARCPECAGPLGRSGSSTDPVCGWCGRTARPWSCPHCQSRHVAVTTTGSSLTAEELGRAFSPTRVVVADGEHPVTSVSDEPQLVVATPGAEPRAPGGYRAVLLLDGDRLLSRESLSASMDCVRWWANAAALAAHGAPVLLVGVEGDLGRLFATWQLEAIAAGELGTRRELHFPPAVRLASVTGEHDHVRDVLAGLDGSLLVDVLGPTKVDDDVWRALVRFPYAAGRSVAAQLRSGIIGVVASVQARQRQRRARRRTPSIRVRLDDPTVL